MKIITRIIPIILVLLVACTNQASVNEPARVVEGYFKALVTKDAQQAINLSCAAWESGAQIDADTFAINPATLDRMTCEEAGQDGEFTLVKCTGMLVLDYDGEKQSIDLAGQAYLTALEDGEWRMCGYK